MKLRILGIWLFGPCACEPSSVFLAVMRERMTYNQTEATTPEQVNRFWAYRARCARLRCVGAAEPLAAAEIALYLPLE